MNKIIHNFYIPVVIALMALVFAISCKKEGEPPTITEMLVSGYWHFEITTGRTYNACEKRSWYYFESSGKAGIAYYQIDVVGNCFPYRYIKGTWELKSDSTIRFVEEGVGNFSEYEILEISMDRLVLRNNADPAAPVTHTFDKIAG